MGTTLGVPPWAALQGRSIIHLSYAHVKICVRAINSTKKKSGLEEVVMRMISGGKEHSAERKPLAFQATLRSGQSYVVILEKNIETK